ncbi:hypothetical protein [uncultured Mediterranean phage]|nr:hypothetical protein [uncultured Mediterranean phage]
MFTSQANKELIWGLLKEQSTIGLTENWKSFFEKQIQAIHTNRHQYHSMIEMNKHLIAICMANLEEIASKTERRYDEYPRYDMKGSGGERYARDLKGKQEDLKKLQGGLKPPEIDFTATNNKAFGNLNQIMERQMADRQKELAEIGKGYTNDAKAWLNISEKSGAPKLKIGGETKLVNEIIKAPKKKVKFKLGSDIYVKLNCNENGVNKDIIFKLSDQFRLVTAFQEDLNISTNITLMNVEVFTKSG